jgi:hypothetical protein
MRIDKASFFVSMGYPIKGLLKSLFGGLDLLKCGA